MTAIVLSPDTGTRAAGVRLDLFPGAATPTVFPARAPFWIGYGFISQHSDELDALDHGTRFELMLDGRRVPMETTFRRSAHAQRQKLDVSAFPNGLSAGWHDFSGRWFDGGRLILSSRTAIQFVEG